MAKKKNKTENIVPANHVTHGPDSQTPATTLDQDVTVQISQLIARIPNWARTGLCLLIVLITAWCNYFVGLAEPKYAFWDENYHITAAQRYIDHIGNMESHPPLGKLLIAAGEVLSGENQGVDKSILDRDKSISGENIPKDFSFAGMRLMPSLFGALSALLFFGLLYELTESRLTALLFSTLYLFENAWIVHFRAVHLDSFQMFFCLAFLLQFVRLWKQQQAYACYQYALLGILAGLGIMIKVNAVIMLALLPVLFFKDAGTHLCKTASEKIRNFIIKSGATVLALALVTLSIFAIHGAIAYKTPDPSSSSGAKDLAYMSNIYKDYLNLQSPMTPTVLLAITTDYFQFMPIDHKGAPKLDLCKPGGEAGSYPLSWPLHARTINYRWDSANGFTSYVQLAGNQISWYLGLSALLLSFITIINRRFFGISTGDVRNYPLIEIFTGLYVFFMLLHLYLGAQRVMYLYHYFIGLLISYILIVLNWQHLSDFHKISQRTRNIIVGSIAVCIIASGMFFMPLSKHWPLSKTQCEHRNIFSNVVNCQG